MFLFAPRCPTSDSQSFHGSYVNSRRATRICSGVEGVVDVSGDDKSDHLNGIMPAQTFHSETSDREDGESVVFRRLILDGRVKSSVHSLIRRFDGGHGDGSIPFLSPQLVFSNWTRDSALRADLARTSRPRREISG